MCLSFAMLVPGGAHMVALALARARAAERALAPTPGFRSARAQQARNGRGCPSRTPRGVSCSCLCKKSPARTAVRRGPREHLRSPVRLKLLERRAGGLVGQEYSGNAF